MNVVTITPPEPLVSLALAKQHLRVEHETDDELIQAYIDAASGHIDGPGGWLGRAIGLQTLEARFDRFGCDLIRLSHGPLQSVTSVTYDDEDGDETVLDDELYTLDDYGALLAYGGSWPFARLRAGSVRVRYQAGYTTIPGAITAAVLLMVGDLYLNRETVIEGGMGAIPMSTTVENLLGPYRVWSL